MHCSETEGRWLEPTCTDGGASPRRVSWRTALGSKRVRTSGSLLLLYPVPLHSLLQAIVQSATMRPAPSVRGRSRRGRRASTAPRMDECGTVGA